jgi:hypothetical protein
MAGAAGESPGGNGPVAPQHPPELDAKHGCDVYTYPPPPGINWFCGKTFYAACATWGDFDGVPGAELQDYEALTDGACVKTSTTLMPPKTWLCCEAVQ